MKFTIKSYVVFSIYLLTFLSLASCGDSVENTPAEKVSVESPLSIESEQETPTIKASSLPKANFSYITSKSISVNQGATAVIDLPDQDKNSIGNLMLALDVMDPAGIEQIFLDFSNGTPDIQILQVCGGASPSCDNQESNTHYRLFITGVNPHDFAWKNGPNTIKVWVDNLQGDRSIAATFELNWQAVVISQVAAEFTNVVVNQATGESTGDLLVSWSKMPGFLFYNVFISTEPGINSRNFTSLADGKAKLSLVDTNVVFEGLDANKEYYFTVSGVDDSGESAFSAQKSVIDLSRGAPVVNDDFIETDESVSVKISVTDNDSSANNQLTIISFTQGNHGRVTDNGDGTLSYLHDGSEVSVDQFTYKVSNGEFDSSTAVVNISISLINDVPQGVDDDVIVNEGGLIIIDVKNNDSDEESLNDTLTISNVSNSSHGTVVSNDDGTITYRHDGSESLSDKFTYLLSDGINDSPPVSVDITIIPVNDAPIITSNNVLILPADIVNTTVVYSALATDSENGTLSWRLDDSQNIFIIDQVTGVVTVNDRDALDYETQNPYNLELIVTDDGVPIQSDTMSIALNFTVSDINEKPLLSITPTSIIIDENAQVADIIASVTAEDPEDDVQNWNIINGNSDGIFGIDSLGNITVVNNTKLNFEVTSQYVLTIQAEDALSPSVYETIDLAVDIADVVENEELVLDDLFGTKGEISFNTYSYSSDDTVVNTVRQSDGKLVLVVNISVDGLKNVAAIRLNTNGFVDSSYGDNGRKTFKFDDFQQANKAIIDSADNIYIVGTETTDDNYYPFIVKIDKKGDLDTSFSTNGKFEYSLDSNIKGMDIHIHSNGYLYVASSGFSSSIYQNVLKLLRINGVGNIVSLNADGGVAEFNLFNFNNFFPIGVNEISTGELVVFGTESDMYMEDKNFAIAVLNSADLSQPGVVTASYDIAQIRSDSSASEDEVHSYLRLDIDSFVISGESNYLLKPSGPKEATMIKVDVSNSAITINDDFASSGAFIADIDGNSEVRSFVETLAVDSVGNITFVARSIINGDAGADDIYIVEQITSAGALNNLFTSQVIMANKPVGAASHIIVEPENDYLYLTNVDASQRSDDVNFQQLSNNGTSVLSTRHLLNFTSSSENLTNINLLSSSSNSSALWVNAEKPVDASNSGDGITLLTNNGEIDHTINNAIPPLQSGNINYGPSLELGDGSIIYTTFNTNTNVLIIYKISDNNFTADVNFVPGVGHVQVAFPFESQPTDIAYDAMNNQVVISSFGVGGTLIVKANATDGTLYTVGSFNNGSASVNIGSNIILSFKRVIPQADGTLIGLGSTKQGGFEQPFLVKILSNGVLDTSFNSIGYKIFDLGMPSQNLTVVDFLQLSDSSLIFNANNVSSSMALIVKVNTSGVLDSNFATSGILNMANVVTGATSTVIDDMTLDANEKIYAVGYAIKTDNDNLVLKINSGDGSLDSLFNTYTTPGYWIFDEGGTERLNKVIFDSLNEHILIGDTLYGPLENKDIRIRAFNLIQNDSINSN